MAIPRTCRLCACFGVPLEDPKLVEFEALALEDRGYYQDGHDSWQHYERSVAEGRGHEHYRRAMPSEFGPWFGGTWRNAAKLPELNGERRGKSCAV